jgi:hypothetical protein
MLKRANPVAFTTGVGENRIVKKWAKPALAYHIDLAPKNVRQAEFNTSEVVQAHVRGGIELDENVDVRSRNCVTSRNTAEDCSVAHTCSTKL